MFGACECVPRSDAGCLAWEEHCNSLDDDCDGAVDEGEPCDDPSIAHVEPFAGSVWLGGTTEEGSGGADAILRILPEGGPSIVDFEGYVGEYAFRASDGALFYSELWGPIRQHDPAGPDPVRATPGCERAARRFGIDALDRLAYVCVGGTVYLGGVEVTRAAAIEAVLPSGRMVLSESGRAWLTDVDGTILAWAPVDAWVGRTMPWSSASTVQGEAAWVLFGREFRGERFELVVMRADGAAGAWELVRRFVVTRPLGPMLALPDGRVIAGYADPEAESSVQLVEHAVDGTSRTIWREATSPVVRLHGTQQLFAGPPP